jgi:hypothetical protein
MNATAALDISINNRLRSAAMRAAVITVGATVLLAGVVGGSAAALNTHPRALAASSALSSAITDLDPYAYWPLNDGASAQSDASGHGRAALTATGSGPAVLHSSSNPSGASGGSVTFGPVRPSVRAVPAQRRPPLPASTRGTLVVWFKLNRTLPGWSQTLIVDNGAATGWGAGVFVDRAGRLVVSDSSATAYSGSVDPNFCRQPTPCKRPLVTRPLNDGRWHMAAFVDQYNIDLRDNGQPRPVADWLPSLMYVDGRLVDATIEGRLLDFLGRRGRGC